MLLDNETATKANAGEGYSGTSETVTTYKREAIKTTLATSTTTQVQAIQDSGSLAGGNIEYQGGWTTTTDTPSSSDQEGETFFDGLNGLGYGIYATGRTFVTLNRVNAYRYNRGIFLTSSANNNAITSTFLWNNTETGYYISASGNKPAS